ncbi:phosphatase inhibitor-domain-containing protein [Trichophaea hybrida]|nr:phosphatase inhibitor-domain-containing protein [Trichophaea hybrida]
MERTRSPASPTASGTQTSTSAPSAVRTRAPDGTLRLRGGPIEDRRVRWDQGVIDNEGMGKKKSKVCCIYHRQRAYDESSSEEDSSSDESSDDDSDPSPRHKACGHKPQKKNAYEKMPKPKGHHHGGLKRQT